MYMLYITLKNNETKIKKLKNISKTNMVQICCAEAAITFWFPFWYF